MILKRYGVKLQSVRPNFDAHAMNEISFARDDEALYTAEDFGEQYERDEIRDLRARSESHVQTLAEHALLHTLEEQVLELEQEVGPRCVLVVENEVGKDMPKTRHTQRVLVEEGENRLHFEFSIDPPLRLGVYRRRS